MRTHFDAATFSIWEKQMWSALSMLDEQRLQCEDAIKNGATRAERRKAQHDHKKNHKDNNRLMRRIVANGDLEDAAKAERVLRVLLAELVGEMDARRTRRQRKTSPTQRCDVTVSALDEREFGALSRARKDWQRLAAKLVKLERHHAAQTEKNRQESEERRRVRAAADAASAARQPKAFTARGESHRQAEAWPVDPLAPTGAADRAREETRKHTSIEEAHAHERALKEKEAARVTALEEKREAVRIGNAIVA